MSIEFSGSQKRSFWTPFRIFLSTVMLISLFLAASSPFVYNDHIIQVNGYNKCIRDNKDAWFKKKCLEPHMGFRLSKEK